MTKFFKRISIALIGLALIVALSGRLAEAQTSAVSLNSEIVQNFAASFPVVRAKADELSAQYGFAEGGSESAAWQAWIGAGGAESQLDATVGQYGFSGFKSWVETLSAVARAYAFAGKVEAIDSQMAEALEKIRNDPNIQPAFKEMMIQQLQHSAAAVDGMRPSQENIDAVTPHLDQLAKLFDEDG